MERQLRDLLIAEAGDPPHRVTVEAVRRRVARRRMLEGACAAVTVVILAAAGVAVAAQVAGPSPRSASTGSVPHPPRYYVQEGFTNAPPQTVVVRATATGAVTARVDCPGKGSDVPDGTIAAAGNQTFFIVCQQVSGQGVHAVVTGSRIYRFHLTATGGISGFSPVPGGMLGRRSAQSLTASPGGAEVAVTVGPAKLESRSPAPGEIDVISTRTGARAVWHRWAKMPDAAVLSFTDQGNELVLLGAVPCGPQGHARCRELRAVSPAAAGGQLSHSRLLLPLSALDHSPRDYINDVMISPDGSTLTAAIVRSSSARGKSCSVLVVRFSAATGKQLRVVYRMYTGNGFFYRFVSADPSGRYILFNAGPTKASVNGWIDHGRLIRLKPANGSNIFSETW
jgi:hypothetical protein